jgi:hypothetical protein
MVALVLLAGWRILSARLRRGNEKMTPGVVLRKNHTSHDFD